MQGTVQRDAGRWFHEQCDGERSHVGDTVLETGYEKTINKQNHRKYFRPVTLQGHRNKERHTDKPITQDRPKK